MKANEAIKYLQQLYPNGGHCWLDEQRIEAIGIAVKALQEEPVSEELEEELSKLLKECEVDAEYVHQDFLHIVAHHFANWQKQQTITKACDWLKRNADSYTWYNEFDGESGMTEDFIDELKKAIQ